MNVHYSILSSLYNLYNTHKDDPQVTDNVGRIAWALEFDLGHDAYGYHELAELAKTPSDDVDSIAHYTKVIKQSLQNLEQKAKETEEPLT